MGNTSQYTILKKNVYELAKAIKITSESEGILLGSWGVHRDLSMKDCISDITHDLQNKFHIFLLHKTLALMKENVIVHGWRKNNKNLAYGIKALI